MFFGCRVLYVIFVRFGFVMVGSVLVFMFVFVFLSMSSVWSVNEVFGIMVSNCLEVVNFVVSDGWF